MIKFVFYALVFIAVLVISIVIMFPLSFAMDTLKRNVPTMSYSHANGTIWDGEVGGLQYGFERVGNVSIKTKWSALASGKWMADLAVRDGGITALGVAGANLSGEVLLTNLRVRGRTSQLQSLKAEIRNLDGEFTLNLQSMTVRDNQCVSASGTVWTDILSGFGSQFDWSGPELSGPLSCENGDIVIRLQGMSADNEVISTELILKLNGFGQFRAVVDNPTPSVTRATTFFGFYFEDGSMVYEQMITPNGVGVN